MIKLLRKFDLKAWLLIALLVGFVVLQVYFDVTLPDYTAKIMNELSGAVPATTASIWNIGVKMLLISLGSVASSVIVGFLAAHLSSLLAKIVRRDVFSTVNSFSGAEINKFTTASLITRSTNDISQVQMAVTMVMRMAVAAPITAIWAIIKIQASSLPLTLATGGAILAMVVFIITVFIIVMPRFKKVQELTDKLNGVTRENLTGLRVVKAYNAEAFHEKAFGRVNKDLADNHVFVGRIMALIFPAMFLVMNAITLSIYWLGSKLINDGSLDIGTMMSFTMLAMQVLMSFMMLTILFLLVPRASVSAKRINEVLETKTSIKGGDIEACESTDDAVVFKNVFFKYPDGEANVIEDVTFTARRGETVAFIGSTGSGKSTLINLIPRFYDCTEGEILVNGINIKDMTLSCLRSKLGYVPQKGVLFSGTVNSNISYGKEGIEESDIENAAVAACADEFINNMEFGFKSEIAQGGKNVSGGQKQRLSIARAIAVDPEIYIFDDSFSALDYKTDRTVRANLKKITKNAVTLIVAQRIGTIIDADQIIVMDNGKVAGIGKHGDLLNNCDVYREIAVSQLSKEELGL